MTALRGVGDAEFQVVVIEATKPVLVEFWAEWCGPCKTMAATLAELAKDKADQLQVVTVDIDKNPLTAQHYGVRGIPTLLLFKGGEPAAAKIGALPKRSLYSWVESLISA